MLTQPSTPRANGEVAPPKRVVRPPHIATDRPFHAHALNGPAPSPSQQSGDGSSWMKMLSSTFLGDHGGGLSLGTSLFTRKPTHLDGTGLDDSAAQQGKRRSKHGLDDTPTFKIALVGGSGVGKTSILRRWLQRPYTSNYSPTIGVDVITVPFRYKTHEVLLSIWDVSSVEIDATQSALHSLVCENLDGIFFVFNVHRVSSIAAVDKWRHSLSKYISAKEMPFYLLAHKADLIQKRIMSSDDIASYAKAAGYRGWIWTVGRSNFGENEKNPAVLEALERMVDAIWKERERKPRVVTKPVGIFDTPEKVRSLEVIQVDGDLHSFSASSLLRIPTKAITTLPRGENLQPIEETFDDHRASLTQRTSDLDDFTTRSSFGANWMLGNEKGMYLRVTDDSVIADHDESEEEEEKEEEDGDEDEDEEDAEDQEHEEAKAASTDQEHEEGKQTVREDGVAVAASEPAAAASPRVDDTAKQATETESAAATKAPTSGMTEHEAWRFFAGSINRARAEEILSGREDGTFLLRRKDAQTLILSYVGCTQIHHALIEFKNQRYHVGSAKSSQAAFPTLPRCLRSVRKYANRGLIFTRNTDFRVVNKEEMALAEDATSESPPKLNVTISNSTASSWRPGSANVTPTTTLKRSGASPTKPRREKRDENSGLLAQQEHVRVPSKNRIDELSSSFYEQLSERLQTYASSQRKDDHPENDEIRGSYGAAAVDTAAMLDMANEELKQLRAMAPSDAERQWRQLVKNMELWNRIVLNLEISPP